MTIGIKHAGPSSSLLIADGVPAGWTISNPTPATGATVTGTTITWTLGAFTADTTVTYTATPPAVAPVWPANFNGRVTGDLGIPVAIGGSRSVAQSGVFLYQQGVYPGPSYQGTADAHILAYGTGTNYSGRNTGAVLFVEEGNNTNLRAAIPLLRFSLEGITPQAIIYEAKLRLYHYRNRNTAQAAFAGPQTVYAARLLRDWIEGNGAGDHNGRAALSGEVTWYWARFNLERWAIGGAYGSADMAAPESSAIASSSTLGTWVEWDVTQMVRAWADSSSPNFGLKLTQDNVVGTSGTWVIGYADFYSGQYATDLSVRPILAVRAYQEATTRIARWELYR